MHKFAGHAIDFHDRPGHLVEVTDNDLPDFVKKAAPIERQDVPLDRWAVVLLTQNGRSFPKFALHSRAFTWIATRLFPKTGQLLPEPARGVAARNIQRACHEYRMPCPEAIKRAADRLGDQESNVVELGRPTDEDDYVSYRTGHLGEIPASQLEEHLTRLVDHPGDECVSSLEVGRELASKIYAQVLSSGHAMPPIGELTRAARRVFPDTVDAEEAADSFRARAEELETSEKVKQASLTVQLQNYQDGTFGILTKTADGQTLGRFPMHTPELVKRAADYFADNYGVLHPKYRRELAVSIVKQASSHGQFVDDPRIRSLAGEGYAQHLHANVLPRLSLLNGTDEQIKQASDVLKELVRAAPALEPQKFAQALEEFDRRTGLDNAWDRHIKDPWLTTFELSKSAYWNALVDGEEITEEQLREFVENHLPDLDTYLQHELVAQLKRDPIHTFESLPDPEKRLIVFKMQEAGVAG